MVVRANVENMAKKVTIQDVAKAAGVSCQTVSNYLNDTGRMSEKTRKKVQKVVEELGYRVNVAARALKTGSSNLIGLAIPDFRQPFFVSLVDAVINAAQAYGYGVIVRTFEKFPDYLEGVAREAYGVGADGWIFFQTGPFLHEGALLGQEYPIVVCGDFRTYGKADLVTMANIESVQNATRWLIAQGRRRIGVLAAPRDMWGMDWSTPLEGTAALRLEGYVRALRQAGLEFDWNLVASRKDWELPGGVEGVSELFDRGVRLDALLCMNDALGIGALHELRNRGVRVPDDVMVIGFDNVVEDRYTDPPLSSIDPDVGEYARTAVELLVKRMQGDVSPYKTVTMGYRLVHRASTLG